MEREYCPYCMNPVTSGEACFTFMFTFCLGTGCRMGEALGLR